MTALVPCSSCSRHVRRNDVACPFCGAVVPRQERRSSPRSPEGLGRTALLALAAASLGTTACRSSEPAAKTTPPVTTTAPAEATKPPPAPPEIEVQAVETSPVSPVPVPKAETGQPAPPASAPAYGGPPRPSLLSDLSQVAGIYGAPPPPASSARLSRGTVTLGQLTTTGGNSSNAERVFVGMRAGLRNCYHRRLALDPASAGRLTLRVKIAPLGEVTDVKSQVDKGVAKDLQACVEARVRTAMFNPPEGGESVVSVPVTFALEE